MKRRNVLLTGAAAIAAPSVSGLGSGAKADTPPDASRLTKDLTPFGSERAASASGYVPAWTGGGDTSPPGWSRGMYPPDPFADEKPLFTVTADNMDKYADMLCEGQVKMFKRYGSAGYKMNVYPSHRTACATQSFYDNTAKNVARAAPVPDGIVFGFVGAFGGVPFPILSDDPSLAGCQAMWNHQAKWSGFCAMYNEVLAIIANGNISISAEVLTHAYNDYFDPDMTPEKFDGTLQRLLALYVGPPNSVGEKFLATATVRTRALPDTAFEYLVGEGRIRQAPGVQYDIPSPQAADSINYDEGYLFDGALDRFTWALTGKKEMIIPYNQHAYFTAKPEELWGPHFENPDLVRYEVHRCYVVEANVAPGAQMTDAHRRFYIDEDSWTISISDLYDSQHNYWRYGYNFNQFRPDMPGLFSLGQTIVNFQNEEYVMTTSKPFGPQPMAGNVPGGMDFSPLSRSIFQPQSLANSGGL